MSATLATPEVVAARLESLIARYGMGVTLKQAGTGMTISDVPAFVALATASDHTPFFSSAVLDTFTLPLYLVTIAGAAPEFGGTVQITTSDFVTMVPPGSTSAAVDYKIRSIIYVCLVAGVPIKTLLLVSL